MEVLTQEAQLSLDHPQAPSPPYFGGELYPFQAVMLQRMLDMERAQCAPAVVEDRPYALTFNKGSLRSPFSSGKTVVVLALVATARPPRRCYLPSPANIEGRLCWVPDRHIASTLIVVASSVFGQWVEAVEKFAPTLSCFALDGAGALRTFRKHLEDGARPFDLVLLRGNGTIRVDQEKGPSLNMSALAALSSAAGRLPWDRVVIDDYDTAGIPTQDPCPPGFFTWYVSATLRRAPKPVSEVYIGFINETPSGLQLPGHYPVIYRDDYMPHRRPGINKCTQLMFSLLAVNCKVDSSVGLPPRPVYCEYSVRQETLALLAGVRIDETAREAIASEALQVAGSLLGGNCSSEADVVRLVMKNHREAACAARAKQAAAAAARAVLEQGSGVPPLNLAVELERLASAIDKGWVPSSDEALPKKFAARCCVPPGPAWDAVFRTPLARWEADERRASFAIDRFKGNVRDGCCQVCLAPIAAFYVFNCCQTLLCSPCTFPSRKLLRECPHCFAPADHKNVVLFRDNRTTTLDKDTLPPQEVVEEKLKHKVDALLAFLHTGAFGGEAREMVPIPGLLGGDADCVPLPAGAPRRVLVFCYNLETTKLTYERLKASHFSAAVFRGTHTQKSEQLEHFRSSTKPLEVLIITASNDCSGMHIPEATDVVFMHKVADRAVEAQLAGRAQRSGRRYSLRVHRLVYQSIED